MMALLLNHLWQSSLCVAGAGLLALALHRNGAKVRFWLWFAASTKFLVPFAALTAISAQFLTPILPPVPAPAVISMAPLAQPFSAVSLPVAPVALPPASVPVAAPIVSAFPRTAAPTAIHLDLESVLLALWLAGFLVIALRWLVRWSRVRALLRQAVVMPVDAPIAVKFSSSRLEPGLVGILRPVILLPFGIEQQLSAAELKAVLAHELCHWRRHDNLLAAIHMLVEALFWFFPLTWWLGARLNAERERACDESVLAQGNDPQMYAEGILKVCRAYLQSPMACVAGVSGGGLKKRIDAIMENKLILKLNAVRKFVLGTSAATALLVPLLLGLTAIPVVQMQAKAAAAPLLKALGSGPTLDEPSGVTGQETTPQSEAKTEILTPPSLDLSGALAHETLVTPVLAASNGTPNDHAAIAASPADSGTADAPRPKTEAGLRCLLGLGQDGCWRGFERTTSWTILGSSCTTDNWDDGCPSGPLDSIQYLGTNATGDDVYSVRYMHKDMTYVLPSPGPDGKIAWCKFDGPPANARRVDCHGGGVALSAKVTSPAGQARILYTRAADKANSGTANASGPKTEAGIRCLLGLGPDGCESVFENPSLARRAIRYCAAGNNWYGGEEGGGCAARGTLESIEHLGTNVAGHDVYSARFTLQTDTYLLPPPGTDGKILTHCEFDGPPADARRVDCLGGGVARSAKVTSPADQARILYTRSAEASAAPSATATELVVMPRTPSGEGDPNRIVCRAPQQIAGSSQSGPPVCLHNHEWWRIAMNGKDVGSDGKTLIDRPTVSRPKGDGDPDAITCRTPQFVMHGPLVPVCRTNRFWADLIKNNQIADANGVVMTRPTLANDWGGSVGFAFQADRSADFAQQGVSMNQWGGNNR